MQKHLTQDFGNFYLQNFKQDERVFNTIVKIFSMNRIGRGLYMAVSQVKYNGNDFAVVLYLTQDDCEYVMNDLIQSGRASAFRIEEGNISFNKPVLVAVSMTPDKYTSGDSVPFKVVDLF